MPVNTFFSKLRKKSSKKNFIYILILFFGMMLFFVIREKEFFLIKNIKIFCEKCSKENLLGLDLIRGKNIISMYFDKKKVEEKIFLANPLIKKVNIKINWPSSVELILDEYEIKACLRQEDYCLFLGEDGRILKKSREDVKNLPKIFYYQKLADFYYKTGEWIDFNEIKFTLSILELLSNLKFYVNEANIKSEELIVIKINSNQEILMSSKKSPHDQKYELTQILKQFKIKGREFKKLDLRFNNPVVVFN